MSRHRNVRNLTEDDYYDDYDDDDHDDDDDDDYHDNGEYAYRPQQQQQQQQQQPPREPPQAVAIAATLPPKQVASSLAEKERLLMGMGFSRAQAKSALTASGGRVEQAVEQLLSKSNTSLAPPTSGISKPPPGFGGPPASIPKTTSTVVTTPPVRFAVPEATSVKTAAAGTTTISTTTTTTPLKSALVNGGGGGTPKKATTTSTPSTDRKVDYGPMPKLPAELREKIQSQRSRLSMVVLGHVDAGKSTLMGQVLLQLGHVQQRTIAKYQKQAAELGKASFALAWVMDEDESERERGVTMEIGTKYTSTPSHDLVILDAPGHADFIPAMITGAASADVGLLVVAAVTGEFEAGFEIGKQQQHRGGQTREHVVLARGLGVSQLIVAVNKLDATEPAWSQARFQHIQERLLPFLLAQGFAPKRIRFVPISGLSGANVKQPASHVNELGTWYKGPTLLEAIDSYVPAQRSVDKPLRAIVTDVYPEGKGVVTKCRVVQGVVQSGDKLVVLPIGDEAVASRIDHGLTADTSTDRLKFAMAGDSIDLFLTGIDSARVAPGCILSHPHVPLRPPVTKKMQAKILVMDQLNVPIIRGAQVILHMHSIDVPAVVSKLIATTRRDGSLQKELPRVLTAGASATVEITLKEKLCLEAFSDCRALGRFVLRRGGDTLAVGIIEKVL